MLDEPRKEKQDNNYPVPMEVKFQLNTVKNSKNSMARIYRAYTSGKIDHTTFRACIYFFSHYISMLRLEKDIEIEKRLIEIESKIAGLC